MTYSTLTDRSIQGQFFPRDEEEFSFIKVEFEVMRSCPSRDVSQIFEDACRNVGDGVVRGKREEQLDVVSITVVRGQ